MTTFDRDGWPVVTVRLVDLMFAACCVVAGLGLGVAVVAGGWVAIIAGSVGVSAGWFASLLFHIGSEA